MLTAQRKPEADIELLTSHDFSNEFRGFCVAATNAGVSERVSRPAKGEVGRGKPIKEVAEACGE